MYRQRTHQSPVVGHDHRIDRLRETFAIQHGRRKNKRHQHHGPLSQQVKTEIQTAVDVNSHNSRKAQNTADRFVVAQPAVLIN